MLKEIVVWEMYIFNEVNPGSDKVIKIVQQGSTLMIKEHLAYTFQ